ncbi:hypothetical protein FJQ98_16070 [Lysinibacillus agricola]|uniref:Adhesin n=1 Tax=Lysinibacillus agricola TaxID=2590012 RepID=A0ABX7AMN9_9BACI|nr:MULTISPECIES: hypothetical protein [Lysinibacillus]KOS61541.1 hypothetical protein AN161_18300 [Lysinibacillus sp. FJAT-14222]QQP10762.1 hypothetical protein FJQ98_16070 [Lysinibacillus agricola]
MSKITLNQFIYDKINELLNTYKEVEFHSANDVMLTKGGCSEQFTSKATDLNKIGQGISIHDVDNTERFPFKENGTKVLFNIKRPRKRKFELHTEYFIWDREG